VAAVSVAGRCEPRFEAVRAAFAATFDEPTALGACVAAVVHGELVVDLWGGHADVSRRRPWAPDTIVNLASAGKGAVAACAHVLVDSGELDLDRPVAELWPAFAANGKDAVTVAQLLDHTAGLPAIREPMPAGSLYDWEAMTAALAAEAPWWEPGTRHGYHVVTFGFLVGEVLRRVTGTPVGELVRSLVAAPTGAELHLGLPDELEPLVAECPPTIVPDDGAGFDPLAQGPDSAIVRAFTNPPDLVEPGIVNQRRFRAATIPASNAVGNARGLATMYAALAGTAGGLVDEAGLRRARAERVRGTDAVLGLEDAFSLGFMLPSPMRPFSPSTGAFGHPGAGGTLGFADPERALGFGFTANQTYAVGNGGDPRWGPIVGALYRCLDDDAQAPGTATPVS
jgi:CubicO group peptidase (beta-lactamase class C family)